MASMVSSLSEAGLVVPGFASLYTRESSFGEFARPCAAASPSGRGIRISAALPELVPSVKVSRKGHRSRRGARNALAGCARAAVQEAVAPATLRVDEDVILEELNRRADSLAYEMSGTNIYLIGMMGCGKTTVGRLLSDALGYGFFDSDSLVEQTVGTTVASIFAEQGEPAFRDLESQAIAQLSSMKSLVVATGGGAILRPSNWRCMRNGVVVWIDVPLELLAKRVVAAGVGSRPILSEGASDNDAFSQALAKLNSVYERRQHLYPAADLSICLEDIADELSVDASSSLSPAMIALRVIKELEGLLERRQQMWQLVESEAEEVECIRNELGQCVLPYGLECPERLSIRLGSLDLVAK